MPGLLDKLRANAIPDVWFRMAIERGNLEGIFRTIQNCNNGDQEGPLVVIKKKGLLWCLFRAPVYFYRWRLGWLFGRRLLLLTHTGRRTGLRRYTVLEVVEYRKEGPEAVVANGFGPDCDWVRNIQAKPDEEVDVGWQHFAAYHRFLGEDEAMKIIEDYERRNRLIAPIVRAGFSWLAGWKYRGGENDRRRLVSQIPLIAFRPRGLHLEENDT
ncbi:MAG: nitroreductase family deazaflavin-dependent oxidoreductase [Terriglobales bacterium]